MIDDLYFAEAARVLWPFAKCSTFIYASGPADCGHVSLTRHKRKSGSVFCHIDVSALIGPFSAEAHYRHLLKDRKRVLKVQSDTVRVDLGGLSTCTTTTQCHLISN